MLKCDVKDAFLWGSWGQERPPCDVSPFCLGRAGPAAFAVSEKVRTRLEELDDFEEVSTGPRCFRVSCQVSSVSEAALWFISSRALCPVLRRRQRCGGRARRSLPQAHAAFLRRLFLLMPEQAQLLRAVSLCTPLEPSPWDV